MRQLKPTRGGQCIAQERSELKLQKLRVQTRNSPLNQFEKCACLLCMLRVEAWQLAATHMVRYAGLSGILAKAQL
jgi:hypothetical protein